MKTLTMTVLGVVFSGALGAGVASAQVPGGPTPGCDNSPERLAANKKIALEFFRPGISGPDRVALADRSYKQHNPAFVKGAKEAGMNDYDYFNSRFGGPPAARQGGAGAGQRAGGPPPNPAPPGNPTDTVLAECDLVTVVHKTYVQDPTLPPGNWYARYTFDTFRIGPNGKFTEHWDAALINPPAPAGGRGN